MAISETSLKDVVMMAVKEINDAGGVLGEKVEAMRHLIEHWEWQADKRDQVTNPNLLHKNVFSH